MRRTLKNANVGIIIDEETEVKAGKKEGGAQAGKARMRGLRIDDDGREVPTLSKITGIITKAGKEHGEARSRMHGTGGFKEMEMDPDYQMWKEGEKEMKKQKDRGIRKEVAKWVCAWRRKAKNNIMELRMKNVAEAKCGKTKRPTRNLTIPCSVPLVCRPRTAYWICVAILSKPNILCRRRRWRSSSLRVGSIG